MADDIEVLTFDQIVRTEVDQFNIYQQLYGLPVTDLLEGSQTLALFEAVAAPLEEMMVRIGLDLPAKYYYGDAQGENLDRIIEGWTFGRVKRIPASTAAGAFLVEGAAGAFVPVGQKWRTPGGVLVEVLTPGTIAPGATSVEMLAQAVLKGAAGNLPAGTTLLPEPPIAGVTRAVVVDAWAGGADKQSDAEYQASFQQWLDSLVRGTRPALQVAAAAAGYTHSFVSEPYSRIIVYCDDGGPVSATKLEQAQSLIRRSWKAAGPALRCRGWKPLPLTIPAEAFDSPTATKAELQAAIAARWGALLANKRMGDGLTRLELLAAAASVPGYNGVNLNLADLSPRLQLDDYGTRFGPGAVLPYERLTFAGAAWS